MPFFGCVIVAVGDPAGLSLSLAMMRMFWAVSPDDEHVIVAPSSTWSASSAADTVTVCGVFQFDGVNVRLAGLAVTSVVPELREMETVTFDDGAIASRAVNVAFDASLTVRLVPDVTMFCVPVPTQVSR